MSNDEFKKEFLKSYYEEWFRSNGAEKPSDDKFDEFIDRELNKLTVNMLQARIFIIHKALFYALNKPIVEFREMLEYRIVPSWEDYLKNKDKNLKLLDQRVSSHEVTIFLQNTMSICLFVSLGHLTISNYF